MLRAVGFGDGDFDKPIIAVANGYSTITPCNAGLNDLAQRAVESVREVHAMPQIFGTITVSDGISMGTEGMKYSLVSREVIADSIETVCSAAEVDGLVAIGGCDKNMPGAMMAIARLNIPSIFVYGGTIKPGHLDGKNLTVVSAFEAVGEFSAGRIDRTELLEVERHACPGVGSCGGMFTANTMSSAIEALGMSLPYSSTMSAEDDEKKESAAESARVLANAISRQLLPRDIMTRKAFENAIAVVMATGGSTNAVLHFLAIARAARVPLTLEDFEIIRRRVPVLCDLKPSGKYVTTELWVTDSAPPALDVADDRSTRTWELEPPPGGSCFRIVRIAPDDAIPPPAEEQDADFLEAHATATLDYVTVLSGRVTLVVGSREVTLGPGDSVVQQGVAHDWQNRGSEPCVLVGVLLSAG